jgi:cytosine/adenosine deaminase-related metal-dependent hydrolase
MNSTGFVNAHTHVYGALAPECEIGPKAAPRRFIDILEQLWWRVDRALDARSLRASARLYVAEALLCGTTTLVDHHESPGFIDGSLDVVADACESLGMRALLCYGATERNDGRDEARRGLAECARFIRHNRRAHVRGLIGLHASFTVSTATLEEAAGLCADLQVATHVHVAEDRIDVDDAHRRGADGPLGRMFARGALPPGSILAHGVHLERAQVRDATANRLWLVQNPRSNAANGVGYPTALAASDRVALGTDGFPSDLRVEADALTGLAGIHEPDTPRERLEARLAAGNRLAADHFGELEMSSDGVEFEPAAVDGGRPRVRRVMVAGHTVVRDGRLLTGDIDAIRAEAHSEALRLWERMEALGSSGRRSSS